MTAFGVCQGTGFGDGASRQRSTLDGVTPRTGQLKSGAAHCTAASFRDPTIMLGTCRAKGALLRPL